MDKQTEKLIKSFFSFCNSFVQTGYSLLLPSGEWYCYQEKPHLFRVVKFPYSLKGLIEFKEHFRLMLDLNPKSLSWLDLDLDYLSIIDLTKHLKIGSRVDRQINPKHETWLNKCIQTNFKGWLIDREVNIIKFTHKKLRFSGLLIYPIPNEWLGLYPQKR